MARLHLVEYLALISELPVNNGDSFIRSGSKNQSSSGNA
jgi:hypothetical protein